MLARFFRRGDRYPRALYASIVDQARQPAFYAVIGVPDTLDGRFDMIVLHLSAVVDRLRNPDRSIDIHGQNLFDLFVVDMEQNLRQMGVGDLSVPKKMKKIGQSFYGRFGAYTHATGEVDLAAAIGRNVFPGDGEVRPAARALAHYYSAARAALATHDLDAILAGRIAWPGIPDLADLASLPPVAVPAGGGPAEGEGDQPFRAMENEGLSDQPAPAGR